MKLKKLLKFRSFLPKMTGKSFASQAGKLELIGGGKPFVSVANETYLNSATLYCWKDAPSLVIGSYCSIAEGVVFILGGDHDLDWVSTYPFIERWKLNQICKPTIKVRGDIVIGSDVWIGHGVTILSGTTIGVGAVIGAGAVVRGDIPPYAIAVGVPAKVIKKRFDEEICTLLEKSQWWLLPKERIKELVIYMDNPLSFLDQLSKFQKQ